MTSTPSVRAAVRAEIPACSRIRFLRAGGGSFDRLTREASAAIRSAGGADSVRAGSDVTATKIARRQTKGADSEAEPAVLDNNATAALHWNCGRRVQTAAGRLVPVYSGRRSDIGGNRSVHGRADREDRGGRDGIRQVPDADCRLATDGADRTIGSLGERSRPAAS